jgi:hypothetical protein
VIAESLGRGEAQSFLARGEDVVQLPAPQTHEVVMPPLGVRVVSGWTTAPGFHPLNLSPRHQLVQRVVDRGQTHFRKLGPRPLQDLVGGHMDVLAL